MLRRPRLPVQRSLGTVHHTRMPVAPLRLTRRCRSKTSGTTSSRRPTTVSKTNASYENARRSGTTSSQTPLPVSKASGTTSSRTPTTVSKTNASYEKARGSGATSSQTPLPVSNTSGTTSSRIPTTVSKTNTRQDDMEDLVLPINLLEMAKNAWKERYGTDLPYSQAWCKLLRDSKGSIWVESKGRKWAVS